MKIVQSKGIPFRQALEIRTWSIVLGMGLFAAVAVISVYRSARDRKELEQARDQARVLRSHLGKLNESFNTLKAFTKNTENFSDSSYNFDESTSGHAVNFAKGPLNQYGKTPSKALGSESDNIGYNLPGGSQTGLRSYALTQLAGSGRGVKESIDLAKRVAWLPTEHTEMFADSIVDIEEASRNTDLIIGRIRTMATILKYSGVALSSIPSMKPVEGPVTSEFGTRFSPFDGKKVFHTGVDIGAPLGSSVKAAAVGRVTYVGTFASLGHTVVIDHGSGTITRYGHLKSSKVKLGQLVNKGEGIGFVGMTGNTTGPHLHYEVWMKSMAMNPQEFFFDLDDSPKVAKDISVTAKEPLRRKYNGMGGE